MKRVALAFGLLLVLVSGCDFDLMTADVETRVRRDGSAFRSMEFILATERTKEEFLDVFRLPKSPPWQGRMSQKSDGFRYLASRDFPPSRQTRTDFVIRPFKPGSPLGKFEGKNEWRVTRRRGLFYTTYVYEETLRFPGLKEAYAQEMTKAIFQNLSRQLQLTDAERDRLLPEAQNAVEGAVDKWYLVGKNADMVWLVTESMFRSLNLLQPRGWAVHRKSRKWLHEQIERGYKDFSTANDKDNSPRDLICLFRANLPGRITRTNGHASGSTVRWNAIVNEEVKFHDHTLFAESRVRQVNYLALLSLLALLALPVWGMTSFFRRYRLILRVARKTRW
jgi:hypothetical protein